jgi:hypothetical protein
MITIAKNPEIGSGTFVTYEGTANICTYWEVVGVVAMVEGAPVGSLIHSLLVTDDSGRAVNQYIASKSPGDVDAVERIKVSEGA